MKRASTEETDHQTKRTKQVLGAKSKGAIYHKEQGKQKSPFGKYIYGNYQGYYTSRRKQGNAAIDPRLDLLDRSYFDRKHILDIGCNSGNVTLAIAKKYNIASIEGVDIDPTLIHKANTNLRVVYSLGHPTESTSIDLSLRFHHFPQCMTNMFGLLPIALPPNHPKPKEFPYTVEFKAADWTEAKVERTYDTILALSITKWIQLHHGDKGLKQFFKKIYDALVPGGVFVLEPQEFSTYQRRAKQIDPSKDVNELEFRPEDYDDFLINQLGFKESRHLGIPEERVKGFSRPVILYIK
ncbi:Bicoid-interacting protein 3-domain-containing protein [Choanephora cucurbitarum]|nr:Bicoid-interacting protein 3-domain-containing protein [Choanephora cucurbitarum]